MDEKATQAILALEDGTIFYGIALGAIDTVPYSCGELVFNTSITGYQEIISDPSYCEQIIMFTQPHIGNVGVNEEDSESNLSKKIWSKGIVIKALSNTASNWRATSTLNNYLIKNNLLGIANVDTRQLTNILRTHGAQKSCIYIINKQEKNAEDKARKLAKDSSSLVGLDLAMVASTDTTYKWSTTSLQLHKTSYSPTLTSKTSSNYHVVVYDFGVKQQILKLLIDRNCEVTVVPAQTSVEDVLKLKPDGVLLSNGPGDPAACHYAIDATKKLLDLAIPVFGICLGFQILALALNGRTSKMKFGHHGSNHPVKDYRKNLILITSQNHGFTVEESSLNDDILITHRSLFDRSLQGIRHKNLFAFGFQGHPEASPGPHDVEYLFDEFMMDINNYKQSLKANECSSLLVDYK